MPRERRGQMVTQVVAMTEEEIDEGAIRRAGGILRGGGLVAFPTETVYGLGGDAFNPASSRRIYAAKGRPSDNPLIVHICRLEDLWRVAAEVPPEALALAEAFWPGPLTMILPKRPELPLETTGGLDTVAVRFPSNRIAMALIDAGGGFIAAPSANRSGRPSPTLARYCVEDLDGRVEMIIDGGEVGLGLESTIIDLTVSPPALLRPGFITAASLRELLGSVAAEQPSAAGDAGAELPAPVDPEEAAGGAGRAPGEAAAAAGGKLLSPKAPGMKYRHYAPKGRLTIAEGDPERVAAYVNGKLAEARRRGLRTAVICARETRDAYRADIVKCAGSRDDAEAVAGSLFRILRELDDEGAGEIYAESFAGSGLRAAVMNRLRKAAGGRIVRV